MEEAAIAIVGAGPAGLAAASALVDYEPVVLEAGSSLSRRDQWDESSVIQGVGGAGLYSDGKFSFWPSATLLWRLEPELLSDASDWYERLLEISGIESAPSAFPRGPQPKELKAYPSVYGDLLARHQMIKALSTSIVDIRTRTKVESYSLQPEGSWLLKTAAGSIKAGRIIIASGRFGPLNLPSKIETVFKRIEVGVRIEQNSSEFFLDGVSLLDPKYIWRDHEQSTEWRTFCCCRDGMTVLTDFAGIRSVSGRADCEPTGYSNVGFNMRQLRPNGRMLWPGIEAAARRVAEPAISTYQEFMHGKPGGKLDSVRRLLGLELSLAIKEGFRRLEQTFPAAKLGDARIIAPTIEGVGEYPVHDGSLACPRAGSVWVAGDVSGSFRGLTAALVSGFVAGLAVRRDL
jgi:uncharacterized FAD-dependent dehydrogenase